MRRLPGPAVKSPGRRRQTPEALFALFRDWQRTQTQSSATALRSLRQQMDVRSCRSRDHQPRGTRAQADGRIRKNARSPERAQDSRAFFLTDDLHGWRFSVSREVPLEDCGMSAYSVLNACIGSRRGEPSRPALAGQAVFRLHLWGVGRSSYPSHCGKEDRCFPNSSSKSYKSSLIISMVTLTLRSDLHSATHSATRRREAPLASEPRTGGA